MSSSQSAQFTVICPSCRAEVVLTARRLLVPDRGLGLGQGADALGAVLITGALMLLVYTIVKPAAEDG